MDIIKKLAEELAIKDSQVKATVDLIDEGNTIPFISRYRKEATGGLNDEVLRTLDERLTYLRGLEERKATVVKSIEEQGKMTPELMKQIEDASTLVAVEDLYRPYKPKRRTRATVAKEKGLEPLAQQILAQEVSVPLEQLAEAYVSEEKGVASAAEALAGASDILAEQVSDEAAYRFAIRDATGKYGTLVSEAKEEDPDGTYQMYVGYTENIAKAAGHRILAAEGKYALRRRDRRKKHLIRPRQILLMDK